ncbi:MAG: N-acetylmuramoyl-L-alanine amidase [Desulfobacteraceae bacterium]|nr:N-acetylmuramoyl-L-alanine amidase [Desulfobacteraceae bacterium]MCB9494723.1 N-acetylmuramoyl-L-alanine amidase [Desulfobacteraceae bacterium]
MKFNKPSKIPKLLFFFIFLLPPFLNANSFEADFSNSKTCIIIDPGHGGNDAGARSISGILEKDFNLYLAFAVKNKLGSGFKVTLTRTSDYSMTDTQRMDIANSGPNKLFISIHSGSLFSQTNNNSVFIGYSEPAETTPDTSSPWYVIKNQFENSNKTVSAINAPFNIASNLLMPFVLIEPGNLNSPSQSMTMKSPEYINDIADSISRGVVDFFEKKLDD